MSFKTIPPSVLLDFGLAATVPIDRRKATNTQFILPHATELQIFLTSEQQAAKIASFAVLRVTFSANTTTEFFQLIQHD
jgi:hypothetical protein